MIAGPGHQRSVVWNCARHSRPPRCDFLQQVDLGSDFRRARVKLQLHAVLQRDLFVGKKLQPTDEPLLGSEIAGQCDDVATADPLGIPLPHVDRRALAGLHDLAGTPVDLDLANAAPGAFGQQHEFFVEADGSADGNSRHDGAVAAG